MDTPEHIQRTYYTDTAHRYDDMHGAADPEHEIALHYMAALAPHLRINSMLDVGCGTGRAMNYFGICMPRLTVVGVEPVRALIDAGGQRTKLSPRPVVQAAGERLPFIDGCFDAVCAVGVLHHVPSPTVLVREMMRVARRTVFLSDYNRFGHGSALARLVKLGLWKSGLWGPANRARTGGKGYHVSDGDGLWYSYSVFDSYDLLDDWAARIILIPTRVEGRTWSPIRWCHPMLTSSHILLCATREG